MGTTHTYPSLSPDIQSIFEDIAAAVHQQWSKGRIAEGWTYGAERNDSLKKTPCLVPYKDLPEIEKDYDRNTARCVIGTLQELGFIIERRREVGTEVRS